MKREIQMKWNDYVSSPLPGGNDLNIISPNVDEFVRHHTISEFVSVQLQFFFKLSKDYVPLAARKVNEFRFKKSISFFYVSR